MGEKGEINRQRIVDAANRLFYQRGYNQTSFSDIAGAAGLSRGNFYYYFKTKDDILAAVIRLRIDSIRAMLAEWEAASPSPRERLKRYARILLRTEEDILRYGCPMGSLAVELSKTQLALHSQAAEMFTLFREWLEDQLRRVGRGDDAGFLALHLLAIAQGISLMGNIFSDPQFLKQEVARLEAWIDSL